MPTKALRFVQEMRIDHDLRQHAAILVRAELRVAGFTVAEVQNTLRDGIEVRLPH